MPRIVLAEISENLCLFRRELPYSFCPQLNIGFSVYFYLADGSVNFFSVAFSPYISEVGGHFIGQWHKRAVDPSQSHMVISKKGIETIVQQLSVSNFHNVTMLLR
jgi:hypothetical protein